MSKEMKSGSQFWGWVLIGLGISFLLDRFDVIDFGDLVATLWPLILVGVGIKMILNRNKEEATSDEVVVSDLGITSEESYVNRSRVFGDTAIKITSKRFAAGNLSTVFGEVKIDLTEADFNDGEVIVTASGIFGEVHVTLPPRIKCAIRSHVAVGEVQMLGTQDSGFFLNRTYQSDGYGTAKKKLRISASQVVGNIVISRAEGTAGKTTDASA